MKHKQSSGTRLVHQTVAGKFEFKTSGKSIAIGFTDQRLSPHAGSATFWGWLRGGTWIKTLTDALPRALPQSNNHLLPVEKALAFLHGLLCDARKLTHVAYLRRDPVAPELIGVRRIASSRTVTCWIWIRRGSCQMNLHRRRFRLNWRVHGSAHSCR